MLPRLAIQPLFQGETRRLAFDSNPALRSGETVDSQLVTIRVLSGVDANPSAMLIGSPSTIAGVTYQMIAAIEEGCLYEVKCKNTTTDGQTLIHAGILAVPMVTTDEGVAQVISSDVIASYDSGNRVAAIPPDVMLTADETENLGEVMLQLNITMSMVAVSFPGVGNLFCFVIYTSNDNGVLNTRLCGSGVNTGVGTNQGSYTFPISPRPGTQVLIQTTGSGDLGTYRVQAEIFRL